MRSMHAAIVAALAGLGSAVPAQADTRTEFIAAVAPSAQALERDTGIPASVTIAMAALESGWGRSTMASSRSVGGTTTHINTLFNIKCTRARSPYQTGCVPIRTTEYTSTGTPYSIVAQFRTYANWNDSMRDFGRLLTTASRYRSAFNYKAYPDQFVTQVRKGGYATDPRYASLVISIMQRYKLYRYNVSGAGAGFPKPASLPKKTAPAPTQPAGYPGLRRGSSGAAVRTLQNLLNAKHGAGLAVDGAYGPRVEQAVRAWQRANRLGATGTVDAATWRSLTPTLKPGARGAEVRIMQQELAAAGVRVRADGVYGPATQAAVREFQRQHRLGTDGIAGARTWMLLVIR